MKQWKKALISPDINLKQAIEAIDRAGVRIVLVIDDQQRLLGTLTDGDVRRALLRHLPMTISVREVMNDSPQTAGYNWSKERMLSVMEEHQLLQLPIIDNNRHIIGLENLHDLLSKRIYDNPVFLMAGGFGTRLRPLTKDCPKPLLKVGDKPILELILESFIKAGFHQFFISTHYMPEMIRNYFGDGSQWGVNIQYVYEETPLGTGGALGLLPQDDINLPMFLMNGDLLTTLDFESLLRFHQEHDSTATMCVRKYEYQIPYGVIESEGHYIRSMVEKPTHHFFINAGIYLLSPNLVKSVKPGTCIDMPTLLERAIADSQNVTMFPLHEYWLDIGRMEDFERAQAEIGTILNG